MIINVRFTVETNDQVHITTDVEEYWKPYPDSGVDEWAADGNTIEPYDPYFGMTLEGAKATKYTEIWAHYESLVSTTEETSSTSTDTTKAKTLQKKSDKRLTKKSNGQTLTVDEQAEEDAYDGFLDWADNNHDLADSGADTVELLTTVDDVNNFDPETDINWTTYVWP